MTFRYVYLKKHVCKQIVLVCLSWNIECLGTFGQSRSLLSVNHISQKNKVMVVIKTTSLQTTWMVVEWK